MDRLSHLTLSDEATNVGDKLKECEGRIASGEHGDALQVMLDAAVSLGRLNARVNERMATGKAVTALNSRVDKLYRELSHVESKFLASI